VADNAVYLDTSGLLAMLDAGDSCHQRAASVWQELLQTETKLVMTDYVRLECWSLIQRRLGIGAAEDFLRNILPVCELHPVGEAGFALLAGQIVLANRRQLSLVDLSSFDCMRREGLRRAFAFDADFDKQGFITPENPRWRSTGNPD